ASSKVDINRGILNTTIESGSTKPLVANFPLKTSILDNDIQFFPEGGELIAQIPGKVAFKAIRSDGLGIDAQVEIVDNTGNVIAKASSQHLGMGELSFLPESGKTYKANVTFKDGSKKTADLPPVKASGMSLAVHQDTENVVIRINANPAYLAQHNNKGFYIVAQNSGIVYYAAQSNIRNISYVAQIPKDKFPSGILQLTLLTANGTPISERLVFIKRNEDILKIDIKSDLQAYNERQKVKLNISSAAPSKTNAGNYSISVIDETKVPANEDTETTILSNLLLSSDLTGYIEKPNYYFNNMDNTKAAHLDLLMLTQGYRKFLYKDAVAGKLPNITYLPEQGIEVSGTIRRANGMPWEKARLLLQIPDRHFTTPAVTDKEGRFKFSNLVFRDSSDVIINARNNVNSAKDIRIMVDGEPYPAIYSNVNAPDEVLNIDSALNTYLKNAKQQYSNAFMLKEVVVQASGTERKPSHLDHSSLSGLSMMADRVTSSEQLQGCANLLNCLAGSGITYIDNMLFLTRAYNQGTRVPVEIYVNGMPVDVNYLASIDANGVESIEVFNNDGISGINRRTNTLGVLVVNLKEVKKTTISKDQLKELFPPANVLTFRPKGYSVERSFYVPKYNGPRPATQPKNLRTTIYWNPVVNTDDTGKATLEYFNGDDKGTYKVVVEGVDAEGNIGRGIYRYQVK
ncbi:carboxypeptidase regulatory-like domain-containing protein, partial [Pseudoxanthomonas sp. SGD-10]